MLNNKLRIYLAAGMGTGADWRLEIMKACRNYDIEWLCPVDTILGTAHSLAAVHARKKMFHLADKFKLDKADIIIAYFTDDSPSRFSGTSWECGYGRASDKHVIMINDMKPSNACFYELVKRMASAYFIKLSDAIEHLLDFFYEVGYMPKETNEQNTD